MLPSEGGMRALPDGGNLKHWRKAVCGPGEWGREHARNGNGGCGQFCKPNCKLPDLEQMRT